jgi:protein-export membrane protein SecD/preprotein translocase SecF subunit
MVQKPEKSSLAQHKSRTRRESIVDLNDLSAPKALKPYLPRRVLTFCVLTIFILLALVQNTGTIQPKLGLDLRGGTTIVLQPQLSEVGKITPEAITQALSILRQRVDGVGVSESDIRAEGSGTSSKIIVSVPGTTERELVGLVGQTAKLSIRPVIFQGSVSTTVDDLPKDVDTKIQREYLGWDCPKESTSNSDDSTKYLVACDKSGGSKYLLGPTNVEGSQINDAQFALDSGALGWTTNLNFDNQGQSAFGELTTKIATLASPRNRIAIVLDGKVVTAPRVDGPITGGSVRIYGGFTQQYAKELSNILKYGALPFSFKVDEVQQISPSLGASQLKSGLTAGLLGLVLISLYLLGYYRALGVLAVSSLLVAFLITYAIFILLGQWIGLTLTLAGIAGAIVSIGVTADSFIVYFERVRDEMRIGTSLRVALERGWQRAKRTILVADAVSLLAAIVLYFSTTGNVRGFAFTLGLTTLIDLFIVYFFTRPLLLLLGQIDFFSKGNRLSGLSQASLGIVTRARSSQRFDLGGLGGRLYRGESAINVVEKPRRWFILSGTLMLISALTLSIVGLNLGLEFKGGTVNTVTTKNPEPEIAREVLAEIGYEGQAIVQIIGDSQIRVETAQLSNDDANSLAKGLAKRYDTDINSIDSQSVGPSWGAEISRKALTGLVWFIIALVIYLTFALEVRMAAAAIVAVIHDVFITVGLYSATGLKVTPAAVIGFLTILGYSLYDTVVVFDKVRENVRSMKRKTLDEYRKVVNLALNQTLIRSINTSIVAVIPIASILLVGAIFLKADTLKDISLALVIGQTIGTYSSIFIAAPLLVKFNSKKFSTIPSQQVIDPLSTSGAVTKSNSEASKEVFNTQDFEVRNLQSSDAPSVFRTFFGKDDLWDNLWVESLIPDNLEECLALVRMQLKQAEIRGSEILLISKAESLDTQALIELSKDDANKTVEITLVAIQHEVSTSDIKAVFDEYVERLRNSGYAKVWISFRDIPSHIALIEQLSLPLEARLKGAYASRNGRCDKLIFTFLNQAPQLRQSNF